MRRSALVVHDPKRSGIGGQNIDKLGSAGQQFLFKTRLKLPADAAHPKGFVNGEGGNAHGRRPHEMRQRQT